MTDVPQTTGEKRKKLLELYEARNFDECEEYVQSHPEVMKPGPDYNVLTLALKSGSHFWMKDVMRSENIRELIEYQSPKSGYAIYDADICLNLINLLIFFEMVNFDNLILYDSPTRPSWVYLLLVEYNDCLFVTTRSRILNVVKKILIHESRIYSQRNGNTPTQQGSSFDKYLNCRYLTMDFDRTGWRKDLEMILNDRPLRSQELPEFSEKRTMLMFKQAYDADKEILRLLFVLLPGCYKFNKEVIIGSIQYLSRSLHDECVEFMIANAGARALVDDIMNKSSLRSKQTNQYFLQCLFTPPLRSWKNGLFWRTGDSLQLFAMMILFSDKFLRFRDYHPVVRAEMRAMSFFRLISRLGIYMQEKIAMAYSGQSGIRLKPLEPHLKRALRETC